VIDRCISTDKELTFDVAEQEEEQEIPEVLEQTMMGQTQIVVEMMEAIQGLLSGMLQLDYATRISYGSNS
jgi:hypothetical protein